MEDPFNVSSSAGGSQYRGARVGNKSLGEGGDKSTKSRAG